VKPAPAIADVRQAARLLGVELPQLPVASGRTPTAADVRNANDLLAEWKKTRLKPAWRDRVKEIHPDRAGPEATDDDIARRTQAVQALNSAYALLLEVNVIPRERPRPAWRHVRWAWGSSPFPTMRTSSASTDNPTYTTIHFYGRPDWPGQSDRWGRSGPYREPNPTNKKKE